jgi:hypothetical protein
LKLYGTLKYKEAFRGANRGNGVVARTRTNGETMMIAADTDEEHGDETEEARAHGECRTGKSERATRGHHNADCLFFFCFFFLFYLNFIETNLLDSKWPLYVSQSEPSA